jgi:hypothetical protein
VIDERELLELGLPAPGRQVDRLGGPAALGQRVRAWLWCHRWSVLLVLAMFVLVGVVHALGMTRTPLYDDDEGTYMAQAWSVQFRRALTHYTYWYDHPPLGWLLLAVWTLVTNGFARAEGAVQAGREVMLVAHLAACGLLYLLARRLGLRRLFAVTTVMLFSLSPVALAFQRMVYLDNLAIPFVLAAFVLALSPQRRLWAYVGSGVCCAAAVLIKETSVLVLPGLVWQVWIATDARTRRFCLTCFGAAFLVVASLYPAYAVVKNELLPGPGHVSLIGGVLWQLFERTASGSLFDASSTARGVVNYWLSLDVWLLALSILALPISFLCRRLRPVSLALAVQVLMTLRGGYLPNPLVIALVPFGALLLGGLADTGWGPGKPAGNRVRQGPAVARMRVESGEPRAPSRAGGRLQLLRSASVLLAVSLFIVVAGPSWWAKDRALMTDDHGLSMRQAEAWVTEHVPRDAWLIVDDAFWVNLVRAGFEPSRTVWVYKLDLDPAIRPPHGWRSIDYLIVTQVERNVFHMLPKARSAYEHSTVVATYGEGTRLVEVRKVRKSASKDGRTS